MPDGVPKDVAVDVGEPNPKKCEKRRFFGFCWAAPKRLPAGAACCWPKPVEVAGCGAPKPNEPAVVVAGRAAPKPKNKF